MKWKDGMFGRYFKCYNSRLYHKEFEIMIDFKIGVFFQ